MRQQPPSLSALSPWSPSRHYYSITVPGLVARVCSLLVCCTRARSVRDRDLVCFSLSCSLGPETSLWHRIWVSQGTCVAPVAALFVLSPEARCPAQLRGRRWTSSRARGPVALGSSGRKGLLVRGQTGHSGFLPSPSPAPWLLGRCLSGKQLFGMEKPMRFLFFHQETIWDPA